MASNGHNIGAEVYTKAHMTAALAGATTNTGAPLDISTLAGRPVSVRAVLATRASLDDGDTAIIDNIKLVSDSVSNFASAVSRVTASDVTLTGATGDSNVDYYSTVNLDLDLAQLPASHKWLRVSARTTLSDTTNTAGQIASVMVFGGHQELPQT